MADELSAPSSRKESEQRGDNRMTKCETFCCGRMARTERISRTMHRRLFWIFLFGWNVSYQSHAFQTRSVRNYRTDIHRRLWSQVGVNSVNGEDNDAFTADQQARPCGARFISPLLDYGYLPAVEDYEHGRLSQKPLLLYLPGFDATFLSPFIQFPELHTIFDVRCLVVSMEDRSTFDELKEGVIDYILNEVREEKGEKQEQPASAELGSEDSSVPSGGRGNRFVNLFAARPPTDTRPKLSKRPVYLAGESFGGILASEVALELLQRKESPVLKGLILINAATCFDRSKLAAEGPLVAEIHPWLYPASLLKLLPLFTDQYSVDQLIMILKGEVLPSVIDNETREAYMGRVAFSLPFVLKFMPQETFQWRLNEWLSKGCTHVASKLPEFRQYNNFPVLIIAGEHDGALPSIDEAERLASIFPDSKVHVVEGAGHASTCGSRIDLAAVFRDRFRDLRRRRQKDPNNSSRTAMKAIAAKGTGKYLGMEPRYDGKTIGLNPLRYWSKKYYRKVQPPIEGEQSNI